MKEFLEKLIGRLEEAKEYYRKEWNKHMDDEDYGNLSAYEDSIQIVNQLAEEYINCSTNISTDKSTTNADHIRTMSDEELAELFAEKCKIGKEFAMCWLQCEVKGSE